MRISLSLGLAFLLSVAPALGGETPWQELAPGVSIRLISSGNPDADGKALYALEIDMPEDTRTYWRVPGETGLPIDLDFSGSSGLSGHEQLWPMPEREVIDGYLDYVYAGHTILPLALELDDAAAQVKLSATLGICSDICVPAQAHLSMPSHGQGHDPVNELRIRQALAEVPLAWEQGPEPAGAVRLSDDGSAILVEIDETIVDPDSLIVAGDLDAPIFGAPQKKPSRQLSAASHRE